MTTAIEVVEKKALAFIEKAKAITKIRTQADRDMVAALLVTNKDLQKEIAAVFQPMKAKAYESWQEVCRQEKAQLDPLKKEETACKQLQIADFREQETIRIEREAKAKAAAEEKAKKERERELEALREAGDTEMAKAIEEAPLNVPDVEIQNKATKIEGVTFREEVRFKIEDESLLAREFLMPNEAAIRAMAKATKKDFPGVKVWTEKVPVMKGGRS